MERPIKKGMKIQFKNKTFQTYFFEFISVFFAVVFAFLLNNWNENRKNKIEENKILTEIYNGLERDSFDLANDEKYYNITFNAIKYFTRIIDGEILKTDSLPIYYYLFARDVLIVQNKSGYESLKSKGLETIKDDTLRKEIINLYEVDYELQRKFNEEYDENKFRQFSFEKVNEVIAPAFTYDSIGNIVDINLPINLDEKEKNYVKSYLWKLTMNKLDRYKSNQFTKVKIHNVRKSIQSYLED